MAEVIEVLLPAGVGFGDGLSDIAIDYIDAATGKTGEAPLKRPSTWAHLGVSVASGLLSFLVLKGNARIMGAVVAGRHLGKMVGEIVKGVGAAPAPAPAAAGVGEIKLEVPSELKVEKAEEIEGEEIGGITLEPVETGKVEITTETESEKGLAKVY